MLEEKGPPELIRPTMERWSAVVTRVAFTSCTATVLPAIVTVTPTTDTRSKASAVSTTTMSVALTRRTTTTGAVTDTIGARLA